MPMYREVTMDIPRDRMAGKRRASFILFSRGRTYRRIIGERERRIQRNMNKRKACHFWVITKELEAGT